MATPDYTVDALLTGAKVRANHPDTGGRPTDAEILRMANGQLLGVMTGRLMAAVQAELGAETTIPVVSGVSKYPLPSRAAGPKLRYVVLADAGNNRYSLTVAPAERWITQNPGLGQGSPPYGCYLEGNNLCLIPTPTSTGYTLVVGYYQRPSQMVLTTSCDKISSVGASSLTMASASLFSSGSKVDTCQAAPHFATYNTDLSVVSVATNVVNFAINTFSTTSLVAGDYLCPANTTCVVPLPVEIQPLLEVRTAMAICRSKNDQSGLKDSLEEEASEMEGQLYTFFSNRIENAVDTMGANSVMDFYGVSGYATRNGLS